MHQYKEMSDIEFLKDKLYNGLFQLALFTIIPFVVYLIINHGLNNMISSLGLNLPNNYWSYPVVIILGFILSITLKKISYLVFGYETISKYKSDIIVESFTEKGNSKLVIVSLVFTALITTGLSEEILFRGFIGKGLIGLLGFTIGNILQACIFASIHAIPLYFSSKRIGLTIYEFFRVFLLAFFYGYCMIFICNGSILPLWLSHGIINIRGMYNLAFKETDKYMVVEQTE